MICYKTCKSYSDLGNETVNICISCISKHYLIYNSSNCVNKEYAIANNYYFNECDKACNTWIDRLSNGNTNCIKCNEDEGYYNKEGKSKSFVIIQRLLEKAFF